MRQIHLCAWLFMMCSTFSACGGQEFSSGSAQDTTDSDSAPESGSAPPDESGSGGTSNASSGSKSVSPAPGGANGDGGSGVSGSATGGASSPSGGASAAAGSLTIGQGGLAPADVECGAGAITFRLLPAPSLPEGYFCDTACGSGWLTITDAEGYTAFSISSACGIASCETCEAAPCAAAACVPTPLAAEGAKLVWNGTYLSKDTCGQKLACQRQACVPPGKYKAKACVDVSATSGERSDTCAPKDTKVCTEVTFDFPTLETIDLVLKRD
jgi:hypothetical protein